MFAIAGQNGWTNFAEHFEGTHGYPGGNISYQNSFFLLQKSFFSL